MELFFKIFTFVLAFLINLPPAESHGGSDFSRQNMENRDKVARDHIIRDVLKGYEKSLRPKEGDDFNDPNIITFGLKFDQLVEVNEVKQEITVKLWFNHQWKDSRLAWDPVNYSHVKKVYITADNLWIPDFIIYNNSDGDFLLQNMVAARIDYDGTVNHACII